MEKIGRYEIIEKLGRGAFGLVYKGRDPAMNRLAAVKVMSEATVGDPELVARFKREAQAVGSLRHPNLVTIFELGEQGGLPFIAMEYLTGKDLERILKDRIELDMDKRIDIVIQAAEGLHHVHTHGIVHRDIKAANIRLLEDGTVKIMDFGIARMSSQEMDRTGQFMGTVNYMSPEQIRSQPVDGRSDLFALGVLFYELVSKRRPFPGDSITAVIYKIVEEDAPALAELRGTPSGWLEPVILRCLEKDPGKRWQSCQDLAAALRMPPRASAVPRLGRYEVVSAIAFGGLGQLLKARDPVLDMPVVIKKIDRATADVFARFRRDAKTASALEDDTIVKVLEFDYERGFVVMEQVDGDSLDRLAGRGAPPGLEASLQVTRSVLLALQKAHAQGLLHRDLRPANVMVTPAGQPRLLGFGKVHLREAPGISPPPDRAPYVSPEQTRGDPVDGRSDVFSMGALLFELVTGRPVVPADVESLGRDGAAVRALLDDRLVPHASDLLSILQRALARDPDRRFQNASQMAIKIGDYLETIGRLDAAGAPGLSSSSPDPELVRKSASPVEFDVFLCHSGSDQAAVLAIAGELKRRGLRPWLDLEQLRPGFDWQVALETQIERIAAAAVFVGPNGLGPWQSQEVMAFLRQFVKRSCPVIPVILGSCATPPHLPFFLDAFTYVDFRKTEPDPFQRLIWGITGSREGS